jgi:hypothetical protein
MMMMMMMMTISAANEGNAPIPANEPALVCREAQVTQPFHYWRGASGQRYLHTVFPLIDCPLLHKVNYILVQCDRDGTRRPLDIGQTVSSTDSLNLAHLRRRAAFLGANEIHIHFLPETVRERAAAETDLAARQLGRTSASRSFAPANDSSEAVCA